MKTFTKTYVNEAGETTEREFMDPEFRLDALKYSHLTPEEVRAFRIADRYRKSDKINYGTTVQHEVAIAALNLLHARKFPQHERPPIWKLVRGKNRDGSPSNRLENRAFAYITASGKEFRFSLRTSLDSYLGVMQDEFKRAIKPQLVEFKEKAFEEWEAANPSHNPLCPGCERQLYLDSSTDVDHVVELQDLLDQWKHVIDFYVGDRKPAGWGTDPKKDYNIKAWTEFHREHAELQLMCKDCNKAKAKEYTEARVAAGKSWWGIAA